MKKITGILILVALLAIVIIQLNTNKNISENRIYHYDKEKEIIIQADEIKLADVDAQYLFTGTFEANKDAKINADIQGKIIRYYVDEGSVVRKGDLLVQLDAALLRLQLDAVNVQIEGFEADEKRYLTLTEADAIQGVKLEKTQMGLKAAIIQRKTLLEQIRKTSIKAPFEGIVTMKMSEVGSFAAPGVPLLMLTDISELKFTVNVSESNLGLFQLDSTYKIQADTYPGEDFSGVVTSIGSKGNMGNSFPVHLEMKNTKDLKIKSKMFGKVVLNVGKNTQGITIAASTLIGSGLEPKVYLVKEGKAVLKEISIARRIKSSVVVAEGLKEGDVIVTNGLINLFDGANVRVKQ